MKVRVLGDLSNTVYLYQRFVFRAERIKANVIFLYIDNLLQRAFQCCQVFIIQMTLKYTTLHALADIFQRLGNTTQAFIITDVETD